MDAITDRVALIVTAVAITLALTFFGLYRHEAGVAAKALADLANAGSANASGTKAISSLQEKLTACDAKNQANEQARDKAVLARIAAETAQHQAEAKERATREKLYATPDCSAMRTTPVCSAVADRLRADAQAADRNAND
jgi:hypothetical protein